jgi:putative iron-dependent peroxidase
MTDGGFWEASTMTAQPGIFALGTSEHCYLELRLAPDVDPARLVAAVAGHTESLSTTGGVNVVVGVRPELWPGLAQSRPEDSVGMNADVVGPDGFKMPATQRDGWIWVSGGSRSAVFDATSALTKALAQVATVESELDGWVYQQDRDLTGFVDGTENPSAFDAPEIVAPGGAGSIVLVQVWEHDGARLAAMALDAQEAMIGRTKADSVELAEDVMAASAHVSRTVVTSADGEELPILRRNTAYGTPSKHGTVFVGFSADRARLQRMLDRMAGVADGVRDELTQVTTPLTGGYYYVPSLDELASYAPIAGPED